VEHGRDQWVVLEVDAHRRQVVDDVYAELPQVAGRPDAGQHQQLRGTYSACGQYDGPSGGDSAQDPLSVDAPHGGCSASFHHDRPHRSLGADGEISAPKRRQKIPVQDAVPRTVVDVRLEQTDALTLRAVEILDDRKPDFGSPWRHHLVREITQGPFR
jgi:hypothetical protein